MKSNMQKRNWKRPKKGSWCNLKGAELGYNNTCRTSSNVLLQKQCWRSWRKYYIPSKFSREFCQMGSDFRTPVALRATITIPVFQYLFVALWATLDGKTGSEETGHIDVHYCSAERVIEWRRSKGDENLRPERQQFVTKNLAKVIWMINETVCNK